MLKPCPPTDLANATLQASRGWRNPVGQRVHHLVGGSHPSAGAPASTTSQPTTGPSDSDAHTTEPGCTPASHASDATAGHHSDRTSTTADTTPPSREPWA